MIYVERPLFAVLPLVLVLWQVAVYAFGKRKPLTGMLAFIGVGVAVVGHAAAITVILLMGGTLSDALLLVLLSGVVSLVLSEKPTDGAGRDER